MVKKAKEKTFNLRRCPKCNSDDVGVIVGREKKGEWECHKCDWKGRDIKETQMKEEEFMKYLDDKGVEVA